MNPDSPIDPIESSLTALLLGELPHEQAAALHQRLAQDAEFAKLYERLKQTINLVRETLATPAAQTADQPTPLKLSDRRREKLLQHFKTVAPKEFARPRRRAMTWLIPVGIAAALVVIIGSIAMPRFTNRTRSLGAWGWSYMPAASQAQHAQLAHPVPPASGPVAFSPDGSPNSPMQRFGLRGQARSGGQPTAKPAEATPPPTKPTGTAIVLPKAMELADEGSTPTTAEGAMTWSAPIPVTVPPPVATGARAQAAPGTSSEVGATELRVFRLANADVSQTADQLAQLFPEPTASKRGSQTPMTPFSTPGGPVRQGGNTTSAANGSDQMKNTGRVLAVPDPRTSSIIVTAPKNSMPQIADMIKELDSNKGRKEAIGVYDLQNADPQDVYNNLHDLFNRSIVRQDNSAQNAMVGQNNPLSRRVKSNAQSTVIAANTQRQFPDSTTLGDAYFSIDPETRRVVISDQLGRMGGGGASGGSGVPALGGAGAMEGREREVGLPEAAKRTVEATIPATVSAPALAPPGATPANGLTVAAVPLENRSMDETAAAPATVPPPVASVRANDLPSSDIGFKAGERARLPSRQPAEARKGAELLREFATAQTPPSSPSSSYYGGGAYGGYSAISPLPKGESVAGTVHIDNVGEVPVLTQPPQSEDKAAADRAPGFDFYLGNRLAEGGRISAQGGTPSAATGQSSPPAMGDQVPILGDRPLLGRLFQRRADEVGGTAPAKSETSASPAQAEEREKLALNFAQPPQPTGSLSQPGKPWTTTSAAHLYAYGDQLGKQTTVAAEGDARAKVKASPIALPPAPAETSLALTDSSGRDVQLLAAANQFGIASAVPEDTRKQGAEEAAKQSQPKIAITGIATKTEAAALTPVPQQKERLAREAKKEFDEKLPSGAIDLQQAKLDQVLDLYGKLVNRQILRPSSLPAPSISMKTETPLSKQDAIQALGATLALNGIAMVNVGDRFTEAMPEAQANTAGAGLATNNAGQLPDSGQYVTHVVQLKRAKPSDLVPALQPLEKLPNGVLPIDSSRLLVLRDSPDNVNRMLETIAKLDGPEGKEDAKLEAAPKPAAPAPVPQPEVQTADNAFSTFSLNVSDVSFKLAAASLEKGVMPEPATVRSEEFINAFDYRDPEPPPGVPVAFAWERAQYPFAQNRDLLRFSIKTAALGRQPGRPLNLVLLLDNSGSMERADRVRIIHEALRVLAAQLQAQDVLSVVTFARTAHLWVDGVPGSQAAQVVEEVSGLTPQGGTNLEDAMNLGYQTALRHYLANGVNRVVLLTDGAANLGDVDPETLKQKVEANRKQGIALDCFGIGWEGYNDDLLEVLSRNGDGRYGFVNSPEEAATEFAGQLAGALHVAASDVKVQVEFNPARVTAYRQIGYAKHQLTKEQFRDNTVNAAQIGAAESGNALYVIAVDPAADGPLAIVRVRYRVPGTADYHEHEWPVPYTGNAVALEQASPAMRLAATASAFSEWLVSSPYAAEVSPDRLLGYLAGVPEIYGADARPKKLEWMIRQAKSIAGK